jgi:predicted short-subunit dehydrogenase-like oxidoreductase (DUF2520 family)
VRHIKTAVILGAGNVAWHFGHQLIRTGIRILQVVNRTAESGQSLASSLDAAFTGSTIGIIPDADLYLIAVTDDAIGKIAETGCFRQNKGLIVHTAGSVNIDIFSGKAINYGVLYPLQTFTRKRPVSFAEIPLLIEANNRENFALIQELANELSDNIIHADSGQRMYTHLAAVMASNFTNHLFALSAKLLNDHHLPFDLLIPLMKETIDKAISMSPEDAQTGPAIRGNRAIIEKHMALLELYPEIKKIYSILSESIMSGKKS